jgi:16S rRNA pseudouridine516 synthase
MMRLDKYLAQATDYSRKEIKKAIRHAEVLVNGHQADDPAMKVEEGDEILLDGQRIQHHGKRYFMLNKPEGVVSVTKDSRNMTAIDLLLDEANRERLHIAGRLDKDATGLLLITDDGDWTHRVISPRKQCDKVYLVQVAEALSPTLVEKFAQGIWLEEEKHRCLPAQLEILDKWTARLTLQEGKYHQVKRMFAALGNRVVTLHRERIAGIVLDPALAPGDYRPLTEAEIVSVSP